MAKRDYFRKKRKGGKRRFTLPLAVVGGFVPLVTQTIYNHNSGWGYRNTAIALVSYLTGWNGWQNEWRPGEMRQGLIPILVGLAVHRVANMVGINRSIARAGIPWIRI